MKKLLISSICFISSALAMEAPQRMRIVNDTDWNLDINYQIDTRKVTRQVTQRSRDLEIENPAGIRSFKVTRGGAVWQYGQKELPTEDAPTIEKAVKATPNETILLVISPAKTLGGAFVVTAKVEEKAYGEGFITNPFPKIKSALAATMGTKGLFGMRKPVIPERYFFDLPEGASMEEVRAAYGEKKRRLLEIAGGGQVVNAPDRDRAERALGLLEKAYTILQEEEKLKSDRASLQVALDDWTRRQSK